MKKLKESDMFHPVKNLLEEKMFCDVFAEVANYDVVGVGKSYEVIVEMKLNMTFHLIGQAIDAIGAADYVFVAIPKRKVGIHRVPYHLLHDKGIGLIEVDGDEAKIQFWGKRHRKSRNSIRHRVLPHHKLTTGGVKSGDGPTEYSITIDLIKFKLKHHFRDDGWMTVDRILDDIQTHYANPKPSVMDTLQAHWNQEWCEAKVEKGKRCFRYKKKVAQ
ncbi:hypothetical protein [Sporosarcina sp. FA9]|uniref:hypothetical protein n=1 Tax=Sporosarcina sp. FA9 TaxID=3413030 RepID=UPI003F654A6C